MASRLAVLVAGKRAAILSKSEAQALVNNRVRLTKFRVAIETRVTELLVAVTAGCQASMGVPRVVG